MAIKHAKLVTGSILLEEENEYGVELSIPLKSVAAPTS
jgi:hypothetical protein